MSLDDAMPLSDAMSLDDAKPLSDTMRCGEAVEHHVGGGRPWCDGLTGFEMF